MRKVYSWICSHRATVLTVFIIAAIASLFLRRLVAVNYDMSDYLPEGTQSTVSMDVMKEEFSGGIPNARVMIYDVTIPEALEYKEKLEAVEGVVSVTWLDDAADITAPLGSIDTDTLETYYKDGAALFSVAIENDYRLSAAAEMREIIGEDNAMAGNAISTAAATTGTISEIQLIAVFAVLFVLVVLALTTRSWLEPLLVLAGLGVAIVINSGSNIIFGEISFVTNAAGSILQLAVSLDYSVFLIHRFEEARAGTDDPCQAMVDALCGSASSILSSGLTTVIGFLALVLMRFRLGPDLGLALAKGVVISLLTVFTFMPALVLSFYKLMDRLRHRPLLPAPRGFGKAVRRIAVPAACLFALVLVPAFLGSNANSYYFGATHMFGEDTQVGADTAAIEAVFGENDTYVLLVPGQDFATQKELSDALHELPQVKSILSYVDSVGAEVPTEYLDESTLSLLLSDNYSRMVISVGVPYEGDETFALVAQIRAIAEEYYPDGYYLAGEGVSIYDLMLTVTGDMLEVNLVAIAAVFLILLIMLRSLFLPAVLVLSIETAIWLNVSVPYFIGTRIFYIAYLIISTIQLGATVDYAILMTDRYRENRLTMDKKTAAAQTVEQVLSSILTSGSALTVVGLLLGYVSSNRLLAQLGIFIGRGALFSLAIVIFVLPGLLYLFDRLVVHQKKDRPPHGDAARKEELTQ